MRPRPLIPLRRCIPGEPPPVRFRSRIATMPRVSHAPRRLSSGLGAYAKINLRHTSPAVATPARRARAGTGPGPPPFLEGGFGRGTPLGNCVTPRAAPWETQAVPWSATRPPRPPRGASLDRARRKRHTAPMPNIARQPAEPIVGAIRPLDLGDVLGLSDQPTTAPPPVAALRAVHHQVARLVASGTKHVEIAAIVGWSVSRISIMLNDPAFRELVQHYKERESELYLDVRARMLALGLDAAATLHERIIDNPDVVSDRTLLEVMAQTMDRAGHAPGRAASGTVGTGLSSDELRTMKQEANVDAGRVIDASADSKLRSALQTEAEDPPSDSIDDDAGERTLAGAAPVQGGETSGAAA